MLLLVENASLSLYNLGVDTVEAATTIIEAVFYHRADSVDTPLAGLKPKGLDSLTQQLLASQLKSRLLLEVR